jgi:hypothetical protein
MISSLTSKDVEHLLFLANQISSKVESEQIELLIFEEMEPCSLAISSTLGGWTH